MNAKSEAVRKSMADLDSSTADNIEARRKELEARLNDLAQAIDGVKQRT